MLNVKSIRDENNQLSQNLKIEYKKIYTDIVCYLRVSNLSDMEQEEVISDVLSMFFDWEKQGKEVKDMIGEDYKQFADDIIAAVNPHNSILQKSKEYLLILIQAICYMFTIDFVFIYLPKIMKGNLSLVYNYSLDMAIRGLLVVVAACFIITYVGKNSFRLSKKQIPKTVRFLIGCCFAAFIFLLVFISAFKDIVLVSINIRFIIVIVVAFWIYKGIRKILVEKNSNLKQSKI